MAAGEFSVADRTSSVNRRVAVTEVINCAIVLNTARRKPLTVLFPGRNDVPSQSGSCVRSEDLCFNKTDKHVGERVPFSPVLGAGFPLIG